MAGSFGKMMRKADLSVKQVDMIRCELTSSLSNESMQSRFHQAVLQSELSVIYHRDVQWNEFTAKLLSSGCAAVSSLDRLSHGCPVKCPQCKAAFIKIVLQSALLSQATTCMWSSKPTHTSLEPLMLSYMVDM